MSRITVSTVAGLLMLVSLQVGRVWAADPVAPAIPAAVQELMQDRKYDEAIAAIDKLLAEKKLPADELLYLKGRAQHLKKDFDGAVATFDQLVKDHAQSVFARRARFAKGVALARKGDFRGAEAIYRAEAEFVLSVGRKQEIANIYLEFADGYFKPAKVDVAPDFAKALEFYTKALDVGPQPDERVRLELRIAECRQNLNQHPEAVQLLTKFIKDHPQHDLITEARYRLGESQLAMGQPVEARRTWQDLLELHSASKSDRQPQAAFRLSETYGLPNPASNEDLSLGVTSLQTFLEKYAEHKLAGAAHLRLVQSYMNRGRFTDAVAAAKKFLDDAKYAQREEVAPVRQLLGLAYKVQGKFDEAQAAFTEFLAKHATHPSWSVVQQEIVTVEFLKGLAAYEAKKYDEAKKLWDAFLARYPLDGRAASIAYRYAQIKFREEKYDEAIAQWRHVVSKYPGSEEASQAQYMIAATLEEKLGQYEEALKEYRKLNWGKFVSEANRRVSRLTARNMTVATERVFRTGETPYLNFKSRNIDSVTVRVYTVDLETYFRKMHLAQGVEQLDISLIDPDATFEYKVPDYQEHRETEQRIEVPLPKKGDIKTDGAGVMAVTVSSKTLEATTLVLQSDLDIVVKSSRDEVFVFAENLKTGKPWANARVLLSNGQQVFAEGTTGEDGVLHKAYKELAGGEDVRVFVVSERHTASNVVGLSGIGVAEGLTDKGYIYTDRPAYRAGQLVHVRGVLRKVNGDNYTVAQGKKYQVDVFDNRNRLVHDAAVELSAFGSFHTHFGLPVGAPQGQYRIVVHDNDKESYAGSFVVHEYQLEPVRLEVTSDRMVYYRGEEIVGKIKASYYYGAPLVGKELRYRLADGRVETATTDDKGEVAFKLATREFREAQPLVLNVEFPERSLATGKTFFLATQGFSIDVKTVRPLYLAGETFEATIAVKDAEGKPIAQDLVLHVLKRTTVDGKTGEVEVAKHELKSDAATGIVKKTLRLDEGATFVLRVSGVDRFKNEVTRDAEVAISDDKDATRLRILADAHSYKVGDNASVVLHWRDAPALALVTYQGAKILDYKLVQLQQGANKLEIPLTAQLAPNFELAVAVMTDTRQDPMAKVDEQGNKPFVRRFHEAVSPFAVERALQVKVEYQPTAGDAKRALVPGEEVSVTVTTTDPQGRPLSAEVSLAMVEQSLLERFPWQVASIHDFFKSANRVSAMRTTSSVTFSYQPQTKPINPQLLAEKDRLEIEAEEKKRLEALAVTGAAVEAGGVAAGTPLPSITPPGNSDDSAATVDFARQIFADGEGQALYRRALGVPGFDAPPGSINGLGWETANQPGGGQQAGRGQARGMGRNPQQRSGLANAAQSAAEFAPNTQQLNEQLGLLPQNLRTEAGFGIARGEQYGWALWGANPNRPAIDTNGSRLDGKQVQQWADYDVNDVQVLQRDGTIANVNLRAYFGQTPSLARAEQFVAQMAAAGNVVLPQFLPSETAYWNPSIATDAQGKATVKFALPERSTAWTVLARGITLQTLAGEGEAKLTVKKDLFGELKLPLAFTDGDNAKIQASVHNDALDKGEIEVLLTTTLGGKSTTVTKKVTVEKKGIVEVDFDQELKLADDAPRAVGPAAVAEFELVLKAGDKTDLVKRAIPVQPFGVPVYSIEGGTARGDSTIVIAPPQGVTLQAPRLQVIVGPTVEQSLLDVLLAPATWCQADALRTTSATDTAASDLLAGLALQNLFDKSRSAGNPQASEIDARIRATVSLLVSQQNDDGGWSWGGKGGGSDRYTTARVVWALSLAKAAGYRVAADEFNKALAFVQAQITAASASDYETRTVLLHALTVAGRPDVTLVNQLYRNRQSLSPMAVAYLALTYVEMDRKQTAVEVLALLDKHNFAAPIAATNRLSWTQSSTELRALYALALELLQPTDARLQQQIDWLMAHRTGHRWSPDKATGPAMLALGKWHARTKFMGEKYKLAIYVNDKLAKEAEFDPAARTQTIDIPATLYRADRPDQRVRFELVGRGQFTYQVVLGGFVPGDKLASTTQAWRVDRYFEPAPLELHGQQIPRGFDVVAGFVQSFRNDLTQLPVAKRGRVELHVSRPGLRPTTPDEELEYLVVTEPLAAGTTVIENSIQGNFDRYEIGPGAITFYVGARRQVGVIAYEVHGYLPGNYRATPTTIRNAYRPDQMAVAKPKTLGVLALGAKSSDAYRLTPRELYELGKRHFDRSELALAAPHLQELFASWSLAPEVYKDTARMLLDVSLAAEKPADVVKFFEIMIEKFPDVELSFAKFMQAGDAYNKIGEYERGYLVFRAVIEASFLREGRVAGFLQDQGEFLRSVDVMSRLLATYPPEPYTAAAEYALAQNVYAKAPQAAGDTKLREKHITRVDLIRQAWQRLDKFLTENPDDPAADEASFALANALLDLELYEPAIKRCQQFAARFTGSNLLDSYWYIIAFCHYARGEIEKAVEMCHKVVDAQHTEKETGRKVESPNKWKAIYILGQIYHSLGQAEAAIREYTRVQDRFEDAREAIAFFAQKSVKLPEVTTIKPGEAVKLDLKYANIPDVNVTVYRIDLMKFSLLRKSLEEITRINLAGIRPIHEESVKLGDGKDYRQKTSSLALPIKEEGAYLVVCRGGDLYSSGMLVVSPLVAEVQEEAAAGRVRVTIRDTVKDRYLNAVHVKTIGSRNSDFVSGETDLRGIFVADGIQGQAMAIAQADGGRYAFFRGTRDLGPPPAAPNAPAQEPQADAPNKAPAKGGKDLLLDDVRRFNYRSQGEQQKQLENFYKNSIDKGFQGGNVLKK